MPLFVVTLTLFMVFLLLLLEHRNHNQTKNQFDKLRNDIQWLERNMAYHFSQQYNQLEEVIKPPVPPTPPKSREIKEML